MSNANEGQTGDLLVYLIEDDEAVLRACAQTMKLADIEVRCTTIRRQ